MAKIYHPSSGIIGDYFSALLRKISHLEIHEVNIVVVQILLLNKLVVCEPCIEF